MKWTGLKGIQEKVLQGGEGDPVRIVQESKIWHYWQKVYSHTKFCPENEK